MIVKGTVFQKKEIYKGTRRSPDATVIRLDRIHYNEKNDKASWKFGFTRPREIVVGTK